MKSNNFSEIVTQRYSCRSYTGEPVAQSIIDGLNDYIAHLHKGPFGSDIRFMVVAAAENDTETLKGLGTYGFIKKPSGFVIGAMKKSEMNHEDYGYLMEKIVLKATELGLGTCWLGGSFNKSTFSERISAAEDETVPAVLSIGYPSDKKRVVERIARWKMDSDNRKPWKEIFFNNDFSNSAEPHADDRYRIPLELTRMAPSAVNYQPWRIIKDGSISNFHFFLERTKNYNENSFMLKSDLQKIDMGIAMSHFEAGASVALLDGKWVIQKPSYINETKRVKYIATWVEG